ncbi:MAG: adenylyltransferase/cytidyltransferase family protein [Candidatus Woesearchaeota archaeon]|jgi:glycerol-3-phosphate cytidylyltransferase|nr:adenylyltransferase/cytidyltransferase family protein [Candidatus Woesearchaeota archaeon]MDP7323602.1 adenylyltransferase/cytidyltransferase family protein [Candidatus Woesearchaeota archaeon]
MGNKIIEFDSIGGVCDRLRNEGKKIVMCNGSFDILHAGHIKFLTEAKGQGDVLVVGLNSDSSIKKYKSEDRPINKEGDRAFVLAALFVVDYVVVFSDVNPIKLLEVVKPSVFVNGVEYGEDCVESEVVKKFGGRVHLVENYKGLSSTKIIEGMKKE